MKSPETGKIHPLPTSDLLTTFRYMAKHREIGKHTESTIRPSLLSSFKIANVVSYQSSLRLAAKAGRMTAVVEQTSMGDPKCPPSKRYNVDGKRNVVKRLRNDERSGITLKPNR